MSESEKRRIRSLLAPARRRRKRRASPRRTWFPHPPSARQEAFLRLECREAFYGGAAGGGKSEALLMAALQHVHVPGYAALILRKDTQRLQLAGGLIPRSQGWLAGRGPVWNAAKLTWRFGTDGAPATLSFGYLQTAADKFRYGSSEYQYIAFDELTEFAEEDYRFLFSRLRSSRRIAVPLRMRAASNPGGAGHEWVKARFIPDDVGTGCQPVPESTSNEVQARLPVPDSNGNEVQARLPVPTVHWKNGIAFVPARIADNPGLDAAEYRRSLAHLPSVVRERLENGDWSVHEAGLLRQHWLRYYVQRDRMLHLLDARGATFARIDERHCRRFATIDPAGTSADRARERRGRAASWSVIQVWDQPRRRELSHLLVLRHVARRRVGFDGLCSLLRATQRGWRCGKMFIENEKLGQAAVDVLRGELPLVTIATGGRDKLARAAPLIAKLERGELFLPHYNNAWLGELEAEWLRWTGLDDETTDQIDAATYAVIVASGRSPPASVTVHPGIVR